MQITGGHKYLPPRQDANAPDLYIPFMAVCTYCLLASISKLAHRSFTPESMYALVSLSGFPLLSPSQVLAQQQLASMLCMISKHNSRCSSLSPVALQESGCHVAHGLMVHRIRSLVCGLQVSQGFGAWAAHCFVLKALMYMLGTSNAIPFLELLAYAGYPFVPICTSLLARLTLGQHYNT